MAPAHSFPPYNLDALIRRARARLSLVGTAQTDSLAIYHMVARLRREELEAFRAAVDKVPYTAIVAREQEPTDARHENTSTTEADRGDAPASPTSQLPVVG